MTLTTKLTTNPIHAKSVSGKKQANSSKITKLSAAVTHKPVVEFGRTKLQKIADDHQLDIEMGCGVYYTNLHVFKI